MTTSRPTTQQMTDQTTTQTTTQATVKTTIDRRFLEARARRIARRVEAQCRRRAPGCRASAELHPGAASFDLSVGLRGAAPEERAWARGLDAATLENEAAVERLADLLTVWLEPEGPAAVRGAAAC